MALLPILQHPDPRLRTKATEVDCFDDKLHQLTKDMLETMYESQGIGLAATQVNIHKRIVVIDVSEDSNQPLVFINPKLTILNDAILDEYNEGCLSVPGFQEIVRRQNHVRIDFYNTRNEAQSIEAKGLLAVCIQHECDHLEGKLFIDYLSLLKRNRITDKLKKSGRMATTE